jgi:hypothetical protein
MLVATHLMEPDFAQWRVWAANIRDGHPEGHPLREKALLLCSAMDAWHNAWLFQRRPNSAQNLTKPLEKPIEKLVVDLIRLGVSPPARPGDAGTRKSTRRSRNDQQ